MIVYISNATHKLDELKMLKFFQAIPEKNKKKTIN